MIKKILCTIFRCRFGFVYNFSLPIAGDDYWKVYFGIQVCSFCGAERMRHIWIGPTFSNKMPLKPGDNITEHIDGKSLKRKIDHKNKRDTSMWAEAVEGLREFIATHPVESLSSPNRCVRRLAADYMRNKNIKDEQ